MTDIDKNNYKEIYDFMYDGISSVVDVSNDFLSLAKGSSDDDALTILSEKLKSMDYFDSFAFYEIKDLIEFKQTYCHPESECDSIDKDVEAHINNGTFSWVLNNNRPTVFTGPISDNSQVLFSLSTKRRIHGMFIANAKDGGEISGVLLDILQLILSIAVFSIDNFHLTNQLTNYAQDLEDKVAQRTKDLESAMVRVELSSKARSEFLANMSHEIRTPMNGVLGMMSLLKETSLDEKQNQYVKTAENSGTNMLAILNDILDLSKLESGNVTIEYAEFNLLETIDDIVSMFELELEEKEVELIIVISPSVPELLVGDKTRFYQLIMNLLGNATKFTNQGEIYLKLSAKDTDDFHVDISASVKDTGVGIPKESLEKIFDAFEQANANESRHFGGTGLGLTLCKKLVTMMGGKLYVKSVVGEGSEFSFNVEMVQSKNKGLRLGSDKNSHFHAVYVSKNEKVFEAVGSVFDCLAIKYTLCSKYDEIEKAIVSHKDESLRVFIDEDIFKEKHLSESELKNKCLEYDIDICIVTGVRNVSSFKNDYAVIVKPFQINKLYNYLHARNIANDASKINEQQKKKILVVEDNQVNQMVAEGMLNNMGCDVTLAENGQVGLDCLAKNKFDLVFMDINMPVLNGREATLQYRKNEPDNEHMPIIALTANVLPEDVDSYFEAGVDDCISKPYTAEQLSDVLSEWVKVDITESQTQTETSSQENDVSNLDVDKIISLKTMMGDVYSELLNTYLNRSAELMQAIRNNDNDYETLIRDVHSLKGSSGSMGATKLFTMCESLELLLRKGVDEDRDNKVNSISEELEAVHKYLSS